MVDRGNVDVMDTELRHYISDHLAGASGALLLIDELANRFDLEEERDFFIELKRQVESDREILIGLLAAIGDSVGTCSKMAAKATARVSFIKLMWEGLEPGMLGRLQALEMLAIGIHSKRLLWVALKEVACWFYEWECVDFGTLELNAIAQRDSLEQWRLEAAHGTLASASRRASAGSLVSPAL